MKEKKIDCIFYIAAFILLLIVSLPMFLFPPHSDHWTLLNFFHHLDDLPELSLGGQWFHCLNWDPNEQTNFRPLFGIFYYMLHRLFGSNFIFVNMINFLLYFFSVVLLYKFALNFSKNRVMTAFFIGLFAFLFIHFDILLWSFHMHIIIGFCMFLLGFIYYIKFLKTDRFLYFLAVILFFFIGMLNYETFFLWPFAIIIISSIEYLRGKNKLNKKKLLRANFLILTLLYSAYILVFFFTRSLGTYGDPSREIFDFLKWKSLIVTGFMVLFNVGYNIVINSLPLLSFPLKVTENIYMAGPIINSIAKGHSEIVFIGGSIIGVLLVFWFVCFCRRKYFTELKILGLFIFLILSETYMVFLPRVIINTFEYSLTEFRYQYIPNAFMILSLIFIIDRFLIFSKKKAKVMFFILLFLLTINIYYGQKIIHIYSQHFVNFKRILSNIKSDIHKGIINADNKVYIDDDLPEYLPSLCWNIWMGERFVKKGNYQWMFSKEELVYFTQNCDETTWVIDKKNFDLIKKYPPKVFEKAKNVGLGKDIQYVDLGNYYLEQKDYDKAKDRFEKAIAINPNNDCAHHGFGVYYLSQNEYEKARIMFERAVKINPRYAQPYADLGHLFNREKEYKKAEEIFRQALLIDKTTDGAYEGLAVCYIGQGRHKEAEEIFKKALKINSNHVWIYADLGHLYNEQKRYTDAEKMFKNAIRIKKDNYGAYAGLAVCYMEQERYQEAEEMFKNATAVDLHNTWSYIDLGHLYNAQKRYKEAEKMFNEVIKIDDSIAGVYQGLGSCYIGQERYQEAEEMFKKAIKIDSDFVQPYVDLGYLYTRLKMYKEAERIFKNAIAINPENESAYDGLATSCREQGKDEEAEQIINKLKID